MKRTWSLWAPGRWPLGLQLALSFALVTALALGGGGALLLRQMEQQQLAERSRTLLAQANAAANLAVELQGGADPAGVRLQLYRFHQQTGVRPLVLDLNGTVVADSWEGSPLMGERLTHPEVSRALKGGQVTDVRWLGADGWAMYGAVPLWQERQVVGAVLVSADITSMDAALRALERQLLLVALLAGALAVGLGVGVSRFLSRPLERLSGAADALARGRLETRVQVGGSREVAALGRSFNAMAADLGRLDQQRKAFVADASHELRTPVASIRALAEGLLSASRIAPEQQQEFLGDIVHECDRAARLIEHLLELARLDMRREARGQAAESDRLSLGQVAAEVVHALRPLAKERGVQLELADATAVRADVAPRLAETVLGNLVENAIKYTPAGGLVRVEPAVAAGFVGIAVADTGPGIPAEHLPLIFERFYRVDKARARATGGAGLGLAIAAEAAALLGGRIQVESAPGRGSTFTFLVPG